MTTDPIASPSRDADGPTALTALRAQHEIISELQRTVRQGPAQLAVRPHPVERTRPRTRGVRATALPPVGVPAVERRRAGLDAVLRDRESVRFYREQPVEPDLVARVVRAGHDADAATWPGEVAAGLGIDLLVAAHRMTGAAPAIYRLGEAVFEPVADLDERDADDLVLQIEHAWSPVILIAVAPFADALARWGDHGERLLNTRAAAAITAALHEAAALGLAGSPFAGFLTSGLRRLLDVDGHANAQLFAACFGHPAEAGDVFTGGPRRA